MMRSSSLAGPWQGPLQPACKPLAAFLMVDQNFALGLGRVRAWGPGSPLVLRWAPGPLLWLGWVGSTYLGAFLGARLPGAWSLDFAVPLCFLVLVGAGGAGRSLAWLRRWWVGCSPPGFGRSCPIAPGAFHRGSGGDWRRGAAGEPDKEARVVASGLPPHPSRARALIAFALPPPDTMAMPGRPPPGLQQALRCVPCCHLAGWSCPPCRPNRGRCALGPHSEHLLAGTGGGPGRPGAMGTPSSQSGGRGGPVAFLQGWGCRTSLLLQLRSWPGCGRLVHSSRPRSTAVS